MVAMHPSSLEEELTKTCPNCGVQHRGSLFSVCPDCCQQRARDAETQIAKEQHTMRVQAWTRLCPPEYRRTTWTHPGLSPQIKDIANQWWPAWSGPEHGLGLYGPSGLGKTRCAWNILRRLHFAGFHVMAVDATDFARAASDNARPDTDRSTRHAARRLISLCQSVRVLLFDDLGKEKATATIASALHDMIEKRTRNALPIIWTSERTGSELAAFLGENYADGIIRRLRERTQIHAITPPS